MFKIKITSNYEVKVGEMYEVHGHVYKITKIAPVEKKPIAWGISINGNFEEALFYIDSLKDESTRKYIKKVYYGNENI